MSMHRSHPGPGDPDGAVLYDFCERCDEHSDRLHTLDDDSLHVLWDRLTSSTAGLTDTERWAMLNLNQLVRLVDRARNAQSE